MGYGESALEKWGYGMSSATITLSLFLIIMSSMAISYANSGSLEESSILGAGAVFIAVSVIMIVIAAYSIYSIGGLHNLYLKVSSMTGRGKININANTVYTPDTVVTQPPPATVVTQPPPATVVTQPPATVVTQPPVAVNESEDFL